MGRRERPSETVYNKDAFCVTFFSVLEDAIDKVNNFLKISSSDWHPTLYIYALPSAHVQRQQRLLGCKLGEGGTAVSADTRPVVGWLLQSQDGEPEARVRFHFKALAEQSSQRGTAPTPCGLYSFCHGSSVCCHAQNISFKNNPSDPRKFLRDLN